MELLINIICGLIAYLFVTLRSMDSVKQLSAKANQPFVLKKYWEAEWLSLFSGLLPIALWALVYNEAGQAVPQATIYVRLSFAFIGGAGAWLFDLLLGKSKKWIKGVIDSKTNELDELKKQP